MRCQINLSFILPEMQRRLISLVGDECLALQTHSFRQVVIEALLLGQHRQQEVQRIGLCLQPQLARSFHAICHRLHLSRQGHLKGSRQSHLSLGKSHRRHITRRLHIERQRLIRIGTHKITRAFAHRQQQIGLAQTALPGDPHLLFGSLLQTVPRDLRCQLRLGMRGPQQELGQMNRLSITLQLSRQRINGQP